VRVIDVSDLTFDARFRALSYDFRVCSNIPGARQVLSRLLGSFRSRSNGRGAWPTYALMDRGEGSERRYVLHLDESTVHEVVSAGSMLDWLVADVSRRAIDTTDRFLTVHAGAVSMHGVAAVLPAPPDHGKTTLTAGLTRAGFSFLSDEVAAIDCETGLVHPFPRPVLIDPPSMDVLSGLSEQLPPLYETFRLRRYHVAPDDLRSGALGEACPIGFVVAPTYRDGADTRLEPMTRAETLMVLAENSFNLDRFGGRGFDVLARVAGGCRGYRLAIGDLTSAIGAVSDLLRT